MPSKMKEAASGKQSNRKKKNSQKDNERKPEKRSNNQKTDEEKAAKQKYFKKISQNINAFLDPDSPNGFQQQDLAHVLGMEKQGFNAYMKAETHFFSVQMLDKIADYLGCSVDHLLDRYEEPTKTLSETAKDYGISGNSLQILREGVLTQSSHYRILIDLFEYLLQEYRAYKFDPSEVIPFPGDEDDSETEEGDPGQVSTDHSEYLYPINETSTMIDHIIRALSSMSSRNPEKYTLPGDPSHSEELMKRVEAQEFLKKHGDVIISAKEARDYYLRESSDKFKEVLLNFCETKMKDDPDYTLKVIDLHTGGLNSVLFDLYKKKGVIQD